MSLSDMVYSAASSIALKIGGSRDKVYLICRLRGKDFHKHPQNRTKIGKIGGVPILLGQSADFFRGASLVG